MSFLKPFVLHFPFCQKQRGGELFFKRGKLKNQQQQSKEASFFVDEQSLEIYSLQSFLRRYPEGRLGCLFEGILHGQLFFVSTLCTQFLTVQYPYYDVIRGCMLGKNVISGQGQSQTNLIHVLMLYGWCYQKLAKILQIYHQFGKN